MILDNAILLAAGLGSRLLPLTADRPKCLIEVGGRTILEHQVEALRAAGVARVTVVGGYRFERLSAFVEQRWAATERPALIFNPFFAVSSSIGSVWAARDLLDRPFCLVNGDTVYDPALVAEGLSRVTPGLNLFVEPISGPEPDDMLVRLEGERVVAVGKDLTPLLAHHRSLGFVAWAGAGAGAYRAMLDTVIAEPNGTQAFHHAVVDRMAREAHVHATRFEVGAWTEIDRPEDIEGWQRDHSEAATGDRRLAEIQPLKRRSAW